MRIRLQLALVLFALVGCGGGKEDASATGPPVIAIGEDVCALCGMTIRDTRFAPAERDAAGTVRSFDAIECLIQDRRTEGNLDTEGLWLPDMTDGKLYPAAQMTVVAAGFPSPMGGGFAAFHDEELAHRLATERGGKAGSLADFVRGGQASEGH